VQVAPILRFFPADHFMLGPNISWTGMFADGDNVNQFGMGLDIGAVFDLNENYYYLRSGGSLAVVGGKGMNSSSGFSLPIAGGIIIPIGKMLAFQIEPGITITWIEETYMTVFNVSLGFCGIGEKSAVSVLQGLGGLTNF